MVYNSHGVIISIIMHSLKYNAWTAFAFGPQNTCQDYVDK